jgi:serine/threonine protein kinase
LVFRPGPSWWVKIGDFGISKRVEDTTALRTVVGTARYMAPELQHIYCPDEPETASEFVYTAAVDIWALGEITYEMLVNQPLFVNGRQLFNFVVRGTTFPTEQLDTIGPSAHAGDFIKRCMAASPRMRLTAEHAMQHEWLRGHEYIDDDDYFSDPRYRLPKIVALLSTHHSHFVQ